MSADSTPAPPDEREPLAIARMLVLSASLPEVQRIARETALARNRLVLDLATEIVVPHVATDSPLAALAALLSERTLRDGV